MKDIMSKLEDYELHIFPGSFLLPNIDGSNTRCSANNVNHLVKLRDFVFSDSKNIIIHYPFEHKDIHKYLYHAYCGIDFSDVRPRNEKSKAGHAKILEYCSVGLPIVCEDNINNLYLVKNGKNAIILPYLSTADDYAKAIINIGSLNINKHYCREITLNNENSTLRANELLKLIN
jgi:hypothetical protein